jgi:hypothetical protein
MHTGGYLTTGWLSAKCQNKRERGAVFTDGPFYFVWLGDQDMALKIILREQFDRYTRKSQLQQRIKPNIKSKTLKVRKPKVLRGRP